MSGQERNWKANLDAEGIEASDLPVVYDNFALFGEVDYTADMNAVDMLEADRLSDKFKSFGDVALLASAIHSLEIESSELVDAGGGRNA